MVHDLWCFATTLNTSQISLEFTSPLSTDGAWTLVSESAVEQHTHGLVSSVDSVLGLTGALSNNSVVCSSFRALVCGQEVHFTAKLPDAYDSQYF